MPKKEKMWEIAKSVAILILLATLVCLCFVYMLSYQNTGKKDFSKTQMEMLGGESVKYQYLDYLSSSYTSPAFIGFSVKSMGENIGFHCLGGKHPEVYKSVLRFYEKLFSDEGNTVPIPKEQGEKHFKDIQKSDHIYVSYLNDLPKSIIYATAQDGIPTEAKTDEYIKELLIVPEKKLYTGITVNPMEIQVYTDIYSFYAVARDSEENYYLYTTGFTPANPADVSFNTNLYLTYTTVDDFIAYEYASAYRQDARLPQALLQESVTDTTPVLLTEKKQMQIKPLSFSYVPFTKRYMDGMLRAFLINPDKVSPYTDEAGVRFYYDEGQNVSITKDGYLEYKAFGKEGLSLAELFSYHKVDNAYDALDYMGASLILAQSLENAHEGTKDCNLYLSDISYNGNEIHITFSYAVDGFPLYIDGKPVQMTFTFEDGCLKYAVYEIRRIQVEQTAKPAVDMPIVLRAMIEKDGKKYAYTYGYVVNDVSVLTDVTLIGRKK